MATISASRHGELQVDACDATALFHVLERLQPRLIVNAAAIVSIPACEADPGAAWQTNTRLPFLLAEYARGSGAKLVHISTDHYYSGDGRATHKESDPVVLLNEYARTKFAAESLITTTPSALVLRTNIVGVRSAAGASFGEWALDLILNDKPGVLFGDQFVSSLDVWSFAEALLDLVTTELSGVVNLANTEVFSKAELVLAIARALGRQPTKVQVGTVANQAVKRPDSLGLDVSLAERTLGRRLPSLQQVAERVAAHALFQSGG
jgi:dTDP-4-dehydrorhamnose reductase